MKIILPLLLLALVGGAWALLPASGKPRRPIGPCQPYAETCPHCSDCSQCTHCSVKRGKCSVCWSK